MIGGQVVSLYLVEPLTSMNMKPPVTGIRWVLALYAATGAAMVVVTSDKSWDVWLTVFGIWILVGMCLVIPLSARVNASGVSALTWRGRTVLAWNDVEKAAIQYHDLELAGHGVRITLRISFFSDADGLIEYVAAHLPPALRKQLD